MPTVPKRATSSKLAGRFVVFDGDEGIIDVAHRIIHADGRVAFTIEYIDMYEQWELRLESAQGCSFAGKMASPDWDIAYPVRMELWRAIDDEHEWLLLGHWTDEDDNIYWAITLWVEDEEHE